MPPLSDSERYKNAALRLKNGSCEDDEPSQIHEALPRVLIALDSSPVNKSQNFCVHLSAWLFSHCSIK
jgi:hypothetical protein